MEKQIFIVNGKPRSGKDTFAEYLNSFTRVYKYSSIEKVKIVARSCGWEGGKTEKDRKFLCDLKLLTTEYSDLAFNDIKKHVDWFTKHNRVYDVMLIDIREPEEIKRAVEEFNAKTIFINNKNIKGVTSNKADANVEKYRYDYIVNNNGTLDDFYKEINKFYNNVINGGK